MPNDPPAPESADKPAGNLPPSIRGIWFVIALGLMVVTTLGFLIYYSQWKGRIAIPTPSETVKDK